MKRTTTGKVFVSIYSVALGSTGLIAIVSSIMERHWTSFLWWLSFSLEFGLIVSPVVLGLSFVIAAINNLFAKDGDEEP